LYNNHYARDAVIEHFGVRVSGGSIELNTIESLLAAGFRSGHLIVELSDPRVPQTRPTDLGTQRVLSPLEFYYGPRNPYVARCFSAGTPILLADGTSRVIEDILPGDTIAAFDETDSHGRADLRSATVARLLPGVTEEWIVLNDGTKVTPGHRYLTEHGTWMAAADLIASDIRAVAADGGLVPLRGTMLGASDANSDAEWITPEPFADAGNLVQPAPVFGWRTYNFEVAELHTYVAANDNDQQEPDKRAA
nr:hypothetical protein [Alphaproteobacteria bacterium]